MSIRRFAAAGLALALTVPLLGTGSAGAAPTVDPVVTNARAWLLTQQQADGGFEVAGFPGFETPDAIVALATSFQTGPVWDRAGALAAVQAQDSSGGKDALDYLDDLIDNEAEPAGDAAAGRAAKIIVLVADPLGIDPADFDPSNDSDEPVDLVARVTSHQQEDGSYDLGALFNGVLYTALALRSQGQTPPQGLIDQILAAQRADGSWDYTGTPNAEFGGEDIDTTGLALLALRAAGAHVGEAAVDAGITWLAARQQADGAWQAFGADDPNATATAASTLSALHVDVTTSAWRKAFGHPVTGTYKTPYAALRAMANADGHINSPNDSPEWGTNTFATTQAVQALSRQLYLRDERDGILSQWAQRIASPAAAPDASAAVDLMSDTLGFNSSVQSARLAATTAAVNSQTGREAAAADLFKQVFNRAIDPSGRNYWSMKLITITRPEMLARTTGSSEFYRKAGGTIPTFVDAAYQAALGRASDPLGRAFWIKQLQNGRHVESVARSLVKSNEYRRTETKNTYQRVLDRQPTDAERDAWITPADPRIEILIARLAASAEFYDVTIP